MLNFMRRKSDAKKSFASTTDIHSASHGHTQPFHGRTISSEQSIDAEIRSKGKSSFLASFRNQFSFGDRRGSCNDVSDKQNVSYNSTALKASSKSPAAMPFNMKVSGSNSKSKQARNYVADDRYSGLDISMDSGMPDSPHAGFETSDTISSHSESLLDTLDSDTIGPSSACTSATCSPILSIRSVYQRPHSPSTVTMTSSDDTITPSSQSRKSKPKKAPAARSARFAYTYDQSSLERSFDEESMLSGDFFRGSSMRSSVSESYLAMHPVAPPRRHKKSQDETKLSRTRTLDSESVASMSPASAKRAVFVKSASEASSSQHNKLNGTGAESNRVTEIQYDCDIGQTMPSSNNISNGTTRLKRESDTVEDKYSRSDFSERILDKNVLDERQENSYSSQGVDGESFMSIFNKVKAKFLPDTVKNKAIHIDRETENVLDRFPADKSVPLEITSQNGYAKRRELQNFKADLHLNADVDKIDRKSLENKAPLNDSSRETNGEDISMCEARMNGSGPLFNGHGSNDRLFSSTIPDIESCDDLELMKRYDCDRFTLSGDDLRDKELNSCVPNSRVNCLSVVASEESLKPDACENSVKSDLSENRNNSHSLQNDCDNSDSLSETSRDSFILANDSKNIGSRDMNVPRRISADEKVNSAIFHSLQSSNSNLAAANSSETDEENAGTLRRELNRKVKQGRKISPLEELYLQFISSGSSFDIFSHDDKQDKQLETRGDSAVVKCLDVDCTSLQVGSDESFPDHSESVVSMDTRSKSVYRVESTTTELEDTSSTSQANILETAELCQPNCLSSMIEPKTSTLRTARSPTPDHYDKVLDNREDNMAALKDPLDTNGSYVHTHTQPEETNCRQVKTGFISPLRLFDKDSSAFDDLEPNTETEVKIMCKVGSERPRRSSVAVRRRDSPVDVIKSAVDQFRLNETSPELYCLFVIDKQNKGLTRVADCDVVAEMSAESFLLCKKEHLANSCEDSLFTPRSSSLSVSHDSSATSFLFSPVSPRSSNLLNERIVRLESELNEKQRVYDRRLKETEESLLRYRSIAAQSVDHNSRVKVLEENLVKLKSELNRQEELVKKADEQLNSCRESGSSTSTEALRECERKLAASQSAMQRLIRDQLCITGWLEEAKALQAKINSDVPRTSLYDIAGKSQKWELKTISIEKTTKCLNSLIGSKQNSRRSSGSDGNNEMTLRKDDRILEVNGHSTFNMQPSEFESRLNAAEGDWKIVVMRRSTNNNH